MSIARHIPHGLAGMAIFAMAPLPARNATGARRIELPSVLVIAKSSNKNEVHYAALVDDKCAPATPAPLRAYWRMLERGPLVTESLLDSEQRWLGLERQYVVNDTIQMALRGMPKRLFTIHTARATDGRCGSWVETTIAGVSTRVAGIFVKQKLFGVDYVLLSGWAESGKLVRERVSLRG